MRDNAPRSPGSLPLLLTRPDAAAKTFWDSLPEALRGALHPIYSPLIHIRPLKPRLHLDRYDGLIFTSSRAVWMTPIGDGRPAFCVGPATTAAARTRGWQGIQSGGTAEELVTQLSQDRPRGTLLHLAGTHTRGAVAPSLTRAGIQTDYVAIYEQMQLGLTDKARGLMAGTHPVLIPLFSPLTARHLANDVRKAKSAFIQAMSPNVAQEVSGLDAASVTVAKSPNAEAMVEAIEKGLRLARFG